MTSDLDSSRRSSGDRARARAYQWDFWPGMAGYGIALTAVLRWGDLDGSNPWRFLWAVLPVIPALWIVRAVVRHVHRVDDYQRLLLVQSLGVGFAIAMIAAVTAGFLGIAGLPMQSAGWIIYGAGMLAWIVAGHLLPKR
jgi:hypothetical protein